MVPLLTQQTPPPPQAQRGQAAFPVAGATRPAGTLCAHASTTLNKMAMTLVTAAPFRRMGGYFFALALASASSIFLMYLAGSLSNFSLQSLQQSLTSWPWYTKTNRSEEHTSELQSRQYLVCRLLLEKKIC